MSDTTNPADVIDPIEGGDAAEVETDQNENTDDQLDSDEADPDEDNGEDGEENPSGDDEADYEEIERGDKRYKVHKDLKADLLRQDDYTRKTQAHSQEVARFEERVKAFETASEESLKASVEAKAIKDRLDAINALTEDDWSTLRRLDHQNGTDETMRLMRELQHLPQKLSEAENTSKAMREAVLKEQSEIQTKQLEQGQAILARDIPGWGPELGNKLTEFAMREYGVTPEKDSAAFMSPAIVKMAHDLFRFKESQRKTTQATKAREATKNPPPKVAKSAAPVTGLSDDLSAEEWARRRNEQVAKRR